MPKKLTRQQIEEVVRKKLKEQVGSRGGPLARSRDRRAMMQLSDAPTGFEERGEVKALSRRQARRNPERGWGDDAPDIAAGEHELARADLDPRKGGLQAGDERRARESSGRGAGGVNIDDPGNRDPAEQRRELQRRAMARMSPAGRDAPDIPLPMYERMIEEEIQAVLKEKRRTKDRMVGRPKGPGREKVSESIFAPNHYCIHHGGVYLNGKIHMAEAVNHNYNTKLNRVTHYDMKLSNGRILEGVPVEYIQVTNASLAEGHAGHPASRDDKAIKKAMKNEGSGDRNDPRNAQGNQKQGPGSAGNPGKHLEEAEDDTALGYSVKPKDQKEGGREPVNQEMSEAATKEHKSDKQWYDKGLYERLIRKWAR
jgi:hypothetical protein